MIGIPPLVGILFCNGKRLTLAIPSTSTSAFTSALILTSASASTLYYSSSSSIAEGDATLRCIITQS